jgi:hypothetical protein
MVLPGGELVITNAEIGNPTRLWMEYGGDWFLQYKTQEQMAEIAEGLADVKNFEVMIDEFGVYQYLHIKKND